MMLVIMMMTIITFGPAAGSPVCVAGIATCSSKASISTSLSSKTDLSISLSSKIDVYFNITIITKDGPHLHMIDSEVDSLRYHHHHHHRRLTFISISLSSPKANWPLLPPKKGLEGMSSQGLLQLRLWGVQNQLRQSCNSILYKKPNMLMITREKICDSRSSSFSLCRLGLGSANHLRQN